MRLYSGMSQQFISDTIHNSIAEKLRDAYLAYFRAQPGPAEVNAWRNSLRSISQVLDFGKFLDHGIILEYQLPLTSKRLDCMILGRDLNDDDHAVIIELKQWDHCEQAEGANEVLTWVGGAQREQLHPSVQVNQYLRFLEDNHTAFYQDEQPVKLSACAYLHNYVYLTDDILLHSKFEKVLKYFPSFSSTQVGDLTAYLHDRLSHGRGEEVLNRVENGGYRPSRKLMQHVSNIIKGKKEFILLDEQLVVYDKVMALVAKGFRSDRKGIVIVKGGPGTGKSVIALNLMADLLLKNVNAHYATGSRAFTQTLREIIGNRGSEQFLYFNSYAQAKPEEIDVLICDEAHRIRKTSNSRFTRAEKRSNSDQIEELFSASKVGIYFIDDRQVVRPEEIGSSDLIKQEAAKRGFAVYQYELRTQFRCAGSEVFVNWINNTLGIERTPHVIWEGADSFEFSIFDSPKSLENAIRAKLSQGYTARVTAGYCWDWSLPDSEGLLVNDVKIGDYERPWNAKPEAKRLSKNIPKATLWAYDPNGINQIGCVYTAQGFEFDYVGVIFGNDLKYDLDQQNWVADKKASFDTVVKRSKERFIDLVKNTYRVLLSRGMKGCYVYFVDKETERFFKTRMEPPFTTSSQLEGFKEIKILPPNDSHALKFAYTLYFPVFSVKAAAGYFVSGHEVEPEGWIQWKDTGKPRKDLFVTQVIGRSMEPKIRDGEYCLFKSNPQGARNGKIVLVQHSGLSDPETGGSYTVKEYYSTKRILSDDQWGHEKIVLKPINPEFDTIEIEKARAEDFRVIAELVEVLR